MRDDIWLQQRLEQIWEMLFPDVDRLNNVKATFKGQWKNKFGHIKRMKNHDTEIAINSFFRDIRVPEFVIDLTIAHELVHYSHGFNSPHQRKHKHPHAGGIVNRELRLRGFGHLLSQERHFTKMEWPALLKEHVKNQRKSQNSLFFFWK